MTTLIGIAGGTASGKTTVAKNLKELSNPNDSVSIIRLDDYYKDLSHLTLEERRKLNFDHPDAYDIDLLIEDLKLLIDGKPIHKPIYDFKTSTRCKEYELVEPSDVIIVEGILTFHYTQLVKLFDMKIFVDTPDDIRFIRRLERDVNDRGRDINHVIKQYLTTVRPMHIKYVEPTKEKADIIVPEGGHNKVAIDIICTKIQTSFIKNLK